MTIQSNDVLSPFQFEVKQVQRGECENTYGTGGTVWPASLVLIKYLEQLVTSKDDKIWKLMGKQRGESLNICELGAGTAVASIAASVLFPDSLIMCTDGDELVVGLGEENIKSVGRKRLEGEGYIIGSSILYPRKYMWGDGTILSALSSCVESSSRLTSAPASASASFDLIIFSGMCQSMTIQIY
jgi:hypothetical protein